MRELAEHVCTLSAADMGQEDWKGNRDGKAEKLILAAYLLWLTGSVLSVTMWDEYGGISVLCSLLRRTAHFLLLFEFLRRRSYTKKDAFGVFLLVFTGIAAGHSVHSSFVIPTLLFVYFSARVCFYVILKATLLFHTVVMTATIAASQTGLIEDVIWYEGERIRHSLGYKYCGYPAHFLLFMTLMWLCFRRKPRVVDAAFLLTANYLMYYFTDSRTDFYLAVLAVAGVFVWTADFHFRPVCVLREFLIKYGAVLAAVGSIAAHCFYNPENPFMLRLNLALNNRFQFGLDAVRNYGFSLFGKEILWVGQGSLQEDPSKIYNYVDCAFLKDTLSLGLVFLFILLAGFYIEGKKLAREKRYMESWALLVSAAYAVFNAHLCMLNFNVFILLLGESFCGGSLAGERKESFSLALRSVIHEKLCAGKPRRVFRTALFVLLAFYMIFMQCLPTAYTVKTDNMHMWVAAGVLLLFAALCQENKKTAARRRGAVFWLLLLFLILAGVSDLILNKRFRNAPFFLLVFGGLFCASWRRMEHPLQLLEEFQWACKIVFAAGLFYCIVARPAVPGVRYSGFLPDAEAYGAVMTVLLAVFLSGMKNVCCAKDPVPPKGRSRTAGLSEILNGTGAVAALYLIWLTQELSAVAAAAAVLTVYAVYWLYNWLEEPARRKLWSLLQVLLIGAAGLALVMLLRFLLYRTAPALGTQIVYDRDKNKIIKVPLQEELLSVRKWIRYFTAKWKNCAAYLRDINLTGHYSRAEYKGKAVWSDSSLVMNLYRYGAAAGICYGLLIPVCLWASIKNTLRRKNFLPAGLAVSSVVIGMSVVTELPFANLNWVFFYFLLAWLIVDEDERRRFFCKRKRRCRRTGTSGNTEIPENVSLRHRRDQRRAAGG